MGIIEILALIFAISVLSKLTVWLVKPKLTIGVGQKMFQQIGSGMLKVFGIIGLVVVGYLLTSAGMSVVEIAAAAIFGVLLFGMIIFSAPEKFLETMGKEMETHIEKFRLSFLVWIAFAIWVLYELFV